MSSEEKEEPARQRILGLWRSPLRGLWLTSVFSVVLLGGMILLIVTGLLSYAAYNPWLGALNDHTPDKGILGFYLFDWPASPSWLFRLNQAIHVTLGIVLIPVVLAKLWSVLPKLFLWPPVRSVAQALERLTLLLLVGGVLFEIVTGLLNIQYWYAFPFSFYSAHFYGAWVTIAALVAHVALKLPHMIKGLRSRSLRNELRTPLEATHPEDTGDDELVASDPRPASISRRGLLGGVGAGSAVLLVTTVGQTLGGPFRNIALLAPRGRDQGDGPNDFPVNKTAAYRHIKPSQTGSSWRLTLATAARPMASLSRPQLLELGLHTYELPIACVEGWSTSRGGRGQTSRPCSFGRRRGTGLGAGGVAPARRCLRVSSVEPHSATGSAIDAGVEGERSRPLPRSWLSRQGHRSCRSRRPQHQVGAADYLHQELMAQKLDIFRRRYGGSPLHLVAMVASLALAGFAGLQLTQALGTSKTTAVAVWLIGAAVAHDLILFPIYTLLDKAGTKLVARPRRTSVINFIRLPVLLSGLLFLVYVPLVGGFSGTTYESITGLPVSVYFGRWLLITGALFGLSGALYALKLGVSGSRGRPSHASSTESS